MDPDHRPLDRGMHDRVDQPLRNRLRALGLIGFCETTAPNGHIDLQRTHHRRVARQFVDECGQFRGAEFGVSQRQSLVICVFHDVQDPVFADARRVRANTGSSRIACSAWRARASRLMIVPMGTPVISAASL